MTHARARHDDLFLLGLVFIVGAWLVHPLVATIGLVLVGAGLARRPGGRRPGQVLMGFGVLAFLLVFGYSLGKDMALRDNEQSAQAAAARD